MGFQSYRSYGIDPEWVERMKKKAKDSARKERLKELADGLTKEDLQDRDTVEALLARAFKVLGEKPTSRQTEQITAYILEQRIDPQNVFHLMKLWSMFR
ncbi:stage VI sporulation protein F [Gorillibacterium sp. sgz5001074]|uniref:stage VI sporulation protein F n=1 Tax=Gorillibacterium sp. sgz5001074 TaxID=3446695 RepID=UPI003F66558C